jgi:hypothetical protein
MDGLSLPRRDQKKRSKSVIIVDEPEPESELKTWAVEELPSPVPEPAKSAEEDYAHNQEKRKEGKIRKKSCRDEYCPFLEEHATSAIGIKSHSRAFTRNLLPIRSDKE